MNGEKYSGNWEKDLWHGEGVFEFSDGSRFVGVWRKDRKHGKCVIIFPDGNEVIKEYVNGVPVENGSDHSVD